MSLAAQELTREIAMHHFGLPPENSEISREQQEFIDVLRDLCRRSKDLPRNPFDALDGETYEAWVQARAEFERRNPAYLNDRGRRIPRYRWGSDAVRAARPVIEQWANTSFLGARWIQDEVEQYFSRRLEQSRRQLSEEEPEPAIWKLQSAPPPPPGCMGIIALPLRAKGVSKAAHKKACHRLVDECIAQYAGSSCTKPTPVGRRFKAGKYEYRHFEFLALRICGMQWEEIRRRYKRGGYKGTKKAVMAGAKNVALQIGIPWPIGLVKQGKK